MKYGFPENKFNKEEKMMGENLLTVFKTDGIDADSITSLAYGTNTKTGEKFARVTFENGTVLIASKCNPFSHTKFQVDTGRNNKWIVK